MKIKYTITILVVILLLVFAVCYIFPKEGLSVGSVHITIPSIEEIFTGNNAKYADIDKIINNLDSENNSKDSSPYKRERKDGFVYMEYPDENEDLLYDFFENLENSKHKTVRVLHYGDSQIEGDRITSFIRKKLQEKFYGEGQGNIPIFSSSVVYNVNYQYSNNWIQHQIIKHSKGFYDYGIMMSVLESLPSDSVDTYVDFSFLKPIFSPLKLYCSAYDSATEVQIFANKNLITSQTLNQKIINTVDINTDRSIKKLRIKIKGNAVLYSLDISKQNGVYVDNISLRGSAGLGFTNSSKQLLSSLADENKLNVKLILMQFGVNALSDEPNKVTSNYYKYFKRKYSQQLAFLKESMPGAEIIVIGSSDRSIKKGDNYITNPDVPILIDAQRQAAKENGCMFWNLFSAMGGENSMPAWVFRDKPLANTDFIHFNARGSEYVGELFYNALYEEYLEYQKHKNNIKHNPL